MEPTSFISTTNILFIAITILIWYLWSKKFITTKVQEACSTGEDKSSDIILGTLYRLIGAAVVTAIVIYASAYILAMRKQKTDA